MCIRMGEQDSVIESSKSGLKQRSRRIARDQFWNEHDRKKYECPDCGRTEAEIEQQFNPNEWNAAQHNLLEVHHKNGKPFDNRPENQIALCRLCHDLRHGNKPSKRAIKALRGSLKTEKHLREVAMLDAQDHNEGDE